MQKRISKLFLIAYLALLFLAGFVLSVPGNYWPWYAATGACAAVAAVLGPRWYRAAGVCGTALAVWLIVGDFEAGVVFREKMARVRAQAASARSTNSEPGSAASRSQLVGSQTNVTSASAGSSR
jgi:hypothetical protein